MVDCQKKEPRIITISVFPYLEVRVDCMEEAIAKKIGAKVTLKIFNYKLIIVKKTLIKIIGLNAIK